MNRNPVKQVFLTWPKTPITKDVLLKDLQKLFELKYCKIVQELHSDGTPHLHAVIQFANSYSCPRIIKKFKDDYPDDWKRLHVRPVKSLTHSIEYCDKDDPDPLIWGDLRRVPKLATATKWARAEKRRLLYAMHPMELVPWSSCLAAELKRHGESVTPNRKFNTLEEVYVFFYEYLPEIGMDIEEYNSMN